MHGHAQPEWIDTVLPGRFQRTLGSVSNLDSAPLCLQVSGYVLEDNLIVGMTA
ncbi:hypothetical protein [Aeromonas sp. 30P]|uniref:hypothetical protein n=1 Tax=Aeromonas sp. 30P TaxID=3452717 RepID=UPI003F792738